MKLFTPGRFFSRVSSAFAYGLRVFSLELGAVASMSEQKSVVGLESVLVLNLEKQWMSLSEMPTRSQSSLPSRKSEAVHYRPICHPRSVSSAFLISSAFSVLLTRRHFTLHAVGSFWSHQSLNSISIRDPF